MEDNDPLSQICRKVTNSVKIDIRLDSSVFIHTKICEESQEDQTISEIYYTSHFSRI